MVRGNEISMIFQEPMTSLNPVYTVGDQISEGVILHQKLSKKAGLEKAIESLRLVGINNPERRVKQYPHEMSGGMRQRVMIAMALACDPDLIIADEPTTALDVTIQAQILELIRKVQDETGAALMLITHDLGVIAETVQDVVVMYAGRVVESGTVDEVLLAPKHPYTKGLLESIPSKGKRGQRLNVIKGTVANPFNLPAGCNFAPRCPYAFGPCSHARPADRGRVPARRRVLALHAGPGRSTTTQAPTARPADGGRALVIDSPDQTLPAPAREDAGSPSEPLVKVDGLVKYYPIMGGILRRKIADVKAVDDVTFTINRGEVFGLVGESGCGKSTLGRTLIRLQPRDGRPGDDRRRGHLRQEGRGPEALPAPDADHLPGPGGLAQPSDADQRHHR